MSRPPSAADLAPELRRPSAKRQVPTRCPKCDATYETPTSDLVIGPMHDDNGYFHTTAGFCPSDASLNLPVVPTQGKGESTDEYRLKLIAVAKQCDSIAGCTRRARPKAVQLACNQAKTAKSRTLTRGSNPG